MDNYAQTEPSQPQQPSQPQFQRGDVGFAQPKPQKQGSPWLWIVGIVIALLIVVVGGWLLLRNFGGEQEMASASPSPAAAGLNTYATPEPTPTPVPSPTPTTETLAMDELQVLVLNGTGQPGEASLLKSELVDLGFASANVEAANADDQNETETTVTFGPTVGADVRSEVEELLENMYEAVTIESDDLEEVDLKIITGPRVDTEKETQ